MRENNTDELLKEVLENEQLADELESVTPGIKAQMAGYLLRSWFPRDAKRRITMLVIALVAVMGGFVYGHKLFYLLLLVLPLFSPRIVGELILFRARMSKR